MFIKCSQTSQKIGALCMWSGVCHTRLPLQSPDGIVKQFQTTRCHPHQLSSPVAEELLTTVNLANVNNLQPLPSASSSFCLPLWHLSLWAQVVLFASFWKLCFTRADFQAEYDCVYAANNWPHLRHASGWSMSVEGYVEWPWSFTRFLFTHIRLSDQESTFRYDQSSKWAQQLRNEREMHAGLGQQRCWRKWDGIETL